MALEDDRTVAAVRKRIESLMYVRDGDEIILGFVNPDGNPVQITAKVIKQRKWGLKVPIVFEVEQPSFIMEKKNNDEA